MLAEPQRVPARSFVTTPYFLVDIPGARVEGINLKSYQVKTELVEAVPDNQLCRLTAKSAAAAFGANEYTEAVEAMNPRPIARYEAGEEVGLADSGPARGADMWDMLALNRIYILRLAGTLDAYFFRHKE